MRIEVVGTYAFKELYGFIEFVKGEADRGMHERVLMDCTRLAGEMTDAERFHGGQRIAEVFGPDLKASLLMPEGKVTKLGELAARNRGARLLVTSDEAEAVGWLVSEAVG